MNINKEYSFVDEKKLEAFIDETIKAWGTAAKASVDNLVVNHGYYYEGGEDPEYTEVDHFYEILSDKKEILDDTIKQFQGFKDKLEYLTDIINSRP